MRVELFIGPLAEFYREPLTVAARQEGQAAPTTAAIVEKISEWIDWISEGLTRQGLLVRSLQWFEGEAEPCRHELPLDAVLALKLFLAHGGSASCPPHLPKEPSLDPAWVAMAESDFADSPYDQLLVPEIWLPAAFDFTFPCPLPDGHELSAGSATALATQCGLLRERLFAATPLDAALWARIEPKGREVRALAQHAIGVLETAAADSARTGWPMLLHPVG
jgi:hypothetical protein